MSHAETLKYQTQSVLIFGSLQQKTQHTNDSMQQWLCNRESSQEELDTYRATLSW